MGRMDEKVVIITGSGSGLGREMAKLFAREGAQLVLAARRKELLEETAALIDGDVLVVPTDITQEDDVADMVTQAVDRYGRETEIVTRGRHDPCVGIRAVPVGEAMLACVVADHYLRQRGQTGEPLHWPFAPA